MAGLARLGRPGGAETRQQPYTARVRDKYKVGCYKREVSITLISVLDIMPLAVIMQSRVYIANSLESSVLLANLG